MSGEFNTDLKQSQERRFLQQFGVKKAKSDLNGAGEEIDYSTTNLMKIDDDEVLMEIEQNKTINFFGKDELAVPSIDSTLKVVRKKQTHS